MEDKKKSIKFEFWRVRPHLPRNTVSKDPVMMAKLVALADKGIRARMEATIRSFAKEKGMEDQIGKMFNITADSQVRFKCSDTFGEALKKAYPKLNVVKEKVDGGDKRSNSATTDSGNNVEGSGMSELCPRVELHENANQA